MGNIKTRALNGAYSQPLSYLSQPFGSARPERGKEKENL